MLIRDLFVSDVTRDIPPVVYFHEQSPAKLEAEVSEYIITGGWPSEHPNHKRVPSGIHEQYVRLLRAIAAELDRPQGPDLPAVWISGFYGSGKSSFAKLLALALDGVALPGGRSLAQALLARDTSPRAAELRAAWDALRTKIDPLAVVFDIGGMARDGEHIHAAAIRELQKKLGYSSTEPLVADFELGLERDGAWAGFAAQAQETLGKPWAEVKDSYAAADDFSRVLSALYPDRYADPMTWFESRAGSHRRDESPEEAVAAVRDMLRFRRPDATLFFVVDEVSQYVLSSKDRVDRLRAFATGLGAGLRGKAWLLALGQQKLDEEADESFLVWAKDRFPPKLRVHLAATNIRDVVHKRLLQKTPAAEARLRELFERHRPELKLYAYDCLTVTLDELVEVYPMLPGHVDLLLQITSALRSRSSRAQGDDQAIRGLLQLLGELFRAQKLADQEVGTLVTLDQIYEVQHSALDSDTQQSMARILDQCRSDPPLLVRAAKAVALLELIQETVPTDAKLVAQCLYDRLDRGNHQADVTAALETLRQRNLLSFSEKQGYKIQSTAGEEWEREKRDLGVAREKLSEAVQESLKYLIGTPERPRLEGRPFPWAGLYSDGRYATDVVLQDPREDAVIRVDFRFLVQEERQGNQWVKRSAESHLEHRIVWLAGDTEALEEQARQLQRARAMVQRYKPRRASLPPARKLLLQGEENRCDDLEVSVREATAAAFMAGTLYFQGRTLAAKDLGAVFAKALYAAAEQILPSLFPHFTATQVQPSELAQLLEAQLSGPSPKFLDGDLGILELDQGRYVPALSGVVPRRVLEVLEAEGGIGGSALLARFGRPPYGYAANVVKACVAGMLRAGKVRVQPEGGSEITAVRDAGVRDLFDGDRAFRRATFFPAGDDDIGVQSRARICQFFEQQLGRSLDREDHAIADAVAQLFPAQEQRLAELRDRLRQLPGAPGLPAELDKLAEPLGLCIRTCRQTKQTVSLVKKHLDVLRDGLVTLEIYFAELTPPALAAVRAAAEVRDQHLAQLRAAGGLDADLETAAQRVEEHLAGSRPWREIDALAGDLDALRQAFQAARRRRLQQQEEALEGARRQLRARQGFSTLSADDAHSVLRRLAAVAAETTEEATEPTLAALEDGFRLDLQRALAQANERLDAILSAGDQPLVTTVDLGLANRELTSTAELDALIEEIRQRLAEHLDQGHRVRIL